MSASDAVKPGALHGITVVELGGGVSAPYCARKEHRIARDQQEYYETLFTPYEYVRPAF